MAVVVQAWVLDGKESGNAQIGAGPLSRFRWHDEEWWLLGFESRGQHLQSLTAIEGKQYLERPVVHCRGGKKGDEEKQDLTGSNLSSIAEKFCKLSASFDCWTI